MIDLSQDPQSVTKMNLGANDFAEAHNYGVSSALGALEADDKDRVKMIQIFDDELSRVFFAEGIVVVEGDSEVLALKQTLRLLPEKLRRSIIARCQIIKARGKPSIISLVKYLKGLGISPVVMHDGDFGVEGAEKFNKPISDAVGNADRLIVLNANLEQAMGYQPPTSDKPYKAYTKAGEWKNPADVPQAWRDAVIKMFDFAWPAA